MKFLLCGLLELEKDKIKMLKLYNTLTRKKG